MLRRSSLAHLSRSSFHGTAHYQAGLQNKQAFLFRLADIVNDLFAISGACARAQALVNAGRPEAKEAVELADLFARGASRRGDAAFMALWSNERPSRREREQPRVRYPPPSGPRPAAGLRIAH